MVQTRMVVTSNGPVTMAQDRRPSWQYVVYTIIAVLSFIVVLSTVTLREISIPAGVNLSAYGPFEPDIWADFDTNANKTRKIPRILHQTWRNVHLPPRFVKSVKSFADLNPDWVYFLWTEDSARKLIAAHYPSLLPLWDGPYYSSQPIRRADALRYVVLYHYGGIYADMDMVNYRPLDFAITRHHCVFTPEPFEHSVFRGKAAFLINNAFMMCAPKHPFVKQLIENLSAFEHMKEVGDSTGPGYLTTQFKIYHQLSKEKDHLVLYNRKEEDDTPYFHKGSLPLSHSGSVLVANTQYFIFSLDEASYNDFYIKCRFFFYLTYLEQRACVNMARRGLVRQPSKYSITDHKWLRTYAWYNFYNYLTAYNSIRSTHIEDIVSNYKIYGGR